MLSRIMSGTTWMLAIDIDESEDRRSFFVKIVPYGVIKLYDNVQRTHGSCMSIKLEQLGTLPFHSLML
jgi:hypothetical protein